MVKTLLRAFRQANNVIPTRLLFYRDGISEGQFEAVQEKEIKAIKLACHELDPNYNPSLTFIVVQKRHRVRFMPTGGGDRSGNIPAGTVVDGQGVLIELGYYDFFLCSHAGIQGTSRPTHYFVVHDENKFPPDEIHRLTYQMCHTFARCTRSVSVVPPAYYAHLVAYRARLHAHMEDMSDAASTVSSGVSMVPRVADALNNTMYFV